MKTILKNITTHNTKKKEWSAATRKVLFEEEYHGAAITNKIRYILFFLILFAIITNAIGSFKEGTVSGIIGNAAMNFLFLAITIIHTVILKRGSRKLIYFFGFVAIVFDYVLITSSSIIWFFLIAPDNPSIIIKNTAISIYFFAIVLTVLHFRISYVIFSSAIFLLIYYAIILSCCYMEVPAAQNWVEYFMGPGIVMVDAATVRPMAFIGAAVIIAYAINRTYTMIIKIGQIESQKQSLSRYFSPDIVDEITSKPDTLNFGSRQKVTILFCDIRDFTTMSEKMSPDSLSVFLSEFRKILTLAVFTHSGTLDKYIGDAVMATFGTPLPSDEPGKDSRNAVKTGYAIMKGIDELNQKRLGDGETPVRIGIGIHTGEVFAGNIGFEDRLEYTVIGDVVNTASRIESLCKQFHAQFLISHDVYREVREIVKAEKITGVMIRGKREPIDIYKIDDTIIS